MSDPGAHSGRRMREGLAELEARFPNMCVVMPDPDEPTTTIILGPARRAKQIPGPDATGDAPPTSEAERPKSRER